MKYSIECFEDGKLVYTENGIMARGGWEKIDEKQYLVGISIYDSVVTLSDNMTQFQWGEKGIIFTRKR